ncbi:hypothetical protein MLD38_000590 [Melastoma candidum]|uniref:Uncharacterized protein n=1 Tax=Melastoma candidum TaxID=119954 RepID=A0ACB9SAP2_9MYRT|nr:hypothetical protein MLD38_000590 [Melastoma candidum]
MEGWLVPLPQLFFLLLILLFQPAASTSCDWYHGSWVLDSSYPLYDPSSCPFIEREFSCLRNGRPDHLYTHYRWHPLGTTCNFSRLDPISPLPPIGH